MIFYSHPFSVPNTGMILNLLKERKVVPMAFMKLFVADIVYVNAVMQPLLHKYSYTIVPRWKMTLSCFWSTLFSQRSLSGFLWRVLLAMR